MFVCAIYYLGWRMGSQQRVAAGPVITHPLPGRDRHEAVSIPPTQPAPAPPLPIPEPTGETPVPPLVSTNEPLSNDLSSRKLVLPIAGMEAKNIQDTFDQARSGERKHEAIDIMAPRNTPVLAIDDGVVAKLFTSKQGGLTIYQFDDAGIYCYYYAHLDHYAENLQEKQIVKRGDVIGYVGSSGDARADAPHLHLAIFRLGPEKHWWQGTPINPFAVLMGILNR